MLPLGVSFAFTLFPGVLSHNPMGTAETISLFSLALFVVGFGTGAVEELVFLGVIMYTLENRFGKTVTILAPSVLFALLHVFGTELDAIGFVFLLVAGTLVGIKSSMITDASSSVWNSALVHGLWNATILGGVFSIGASAHVSSNASLYTYALSSDSIFLTGGKFGVESSVITMAGFVVISVIALILIRLSGSRDPDMTEQKEVVEDQA